jgi:hypothetical protein
MGLGVAFQQPVAQAILRQQALDLLAGGLGIAGKIFQARSPA